MIRHYLYLLLRAIPGYRFVRYLRDGVFGMSDFLYDYRRFARYSGALGSDISVASRLARVTKSYHSIEKGLSLRNPRPGFGRGYPAEPIGNLLREVPLLEAQGHSGAETDAARAAVSAYVQWHDDNGHVVDDSVRSFARSHRSGGTLSVERDALLTAAKADFRSLALSRHSIRHFTGAPVSIDAIRAAVSIALHSPRVCNRESRRVRVALSDRTRERMLGLQNGNGGFGHLAGAVLIITSDVRQFLDFGERNQCWI